METATSIVVGWLANRDFSSLPRYSIKKATSGESTDTVSLWKESMNSDDISESRFRTQNYRMIIGKIDLGRVDLDLQEVKE